MAETSLARLESPTEDKHKRAERAEIKPSDLSLWQFVNDGWGSLNPGRKFYDNWHIGAICEHLTAVRKGQIKRLVINQPPRTSKTTVARVAFPAWVWTDEPWFQWLSLSHSEKLALRDNVAMRRLITSPWYTDTFGSFTLTSDQNQKQRFENDWGGTSLAFGMLSSGQGEGGDGIIIDDPMDRRHAFSDAERMSILEEFDKKWSTRHNDPRTGFTVVVMQRLSENDVAGHCLADLGYEHLCLPMRFESDRKCVTSIGWEDPRTSEGELLWPERIPDAEVKLLETQLGHEAPGQLQQNPAPREGNIIKLHWLRYWQPLGANLPPVQVRLEDQTIYEIQAVTLPVSFDTVIQSWDMSFKDKATSSYVAGGLWGKSGANAYFLDQDRRRMDFAETCRAVVSMSEKWPQALTKLVESKANGPAVVSSLKGTIPGFVEVEKNDSKEAQLYACQPLFEGGNVYLPHPSLFAWVAAYVTELTVFPGAANDDQVDQTTQALKRLFPQGLASVKPSTPVYTPSANREIYRPI